MDLNCSITELHNIGEQRAKKLNHLGIFTAEDLLTHFPREYDDRSNICKIKDLVLNEENTFLAHVKGQGESTCIKNITFTRVKLYDKTGSILAVWYNQLYMKKAFEEHTEYLFTGKVQKKYGKLEVSAPEYEKAEIALNKIDHGLRGLHLARSPLRVLWLAAEDESLLRSLPLRISA